MPSKYDRAGALPLRVPPELRAAVDALVAELPRGLPLNRNAVSVAALSVGLDALRAQLAADPFAVHRAYAAAVEGEHQAQGVLPSTSTPAAGAPIARDNGGARAPGVAPDASRDRDEGAPDPAAARSRPRAETSTRRRSTPATRGGAPLPSTGVPEPPDAPAPDIVRELLSTVLDRDRAAPSGAKGWTVKALAAALGCDRRAVQAFRADGSGMGRPLQLRLWDALRRDPPPKG